MGLNAGGKNKAASAYYLPLHRVVRALHILQGCAPPEGPLGGAWQRPCIPRGDLQTTFQFKGYDEVRRLGVTREAEAAARAQQGQRVAPESPGVWGWVGGGDGEGGRPYNSASCFIKTPPPPHQTTTDAILDDSSHQGMLVVESVVPGSPADDVLEPGDVLIALNNTTMTHFLDMETLLDEHVGQHVTLDFQRGGVAHHASLQVTDLHSVTPNRLLEVCGGGVHALSYQQARNNRVTVGQVYVAEAGYLLHRAGVPKHAIITALANVPTPDMHTFQEVLLGLQQGDQVPVEYYLFMERTRRKQGILHVDWKWYGGFWM